MVKFKIKTGERITPKEFIRRWKEGIENLTPLQRTVNERNSTFTMLIGYIAGLVSMIIYLNQMPIKLLAYGLILIFLGASWSNLIKFITLRNQVKAFSEIDKGGIDVNELLSNLEEKESEELKGGEIKDGLPKKE